MSDDTFDFVAQAEDEVVDENALGWLEPFKERFFELDGVKCQILPMSFVDKVQVFEDIRHQLGTMLKEGGLADVDTFIDSLGVEDDVEEAIDGKVDMTVFKVIMQIILNLDPAFVSKVRGKVLMNFAVKRQVDDRYKQIGQGEGKVAIDDIWGEASSPSHMYMLLFRGLCINFASFAGFKGVGA